MIQHSRTKIGDPNWPGGESRPSRSQGFYYRNELSNRGSTIEMSCPTTFGFLKLAFFLGGKYGEVGFGNTPFSDKRT